MNELFDIIKKIMEDPDFEREFQEWREKHGSTETHDGN